MRKATPRYFVAGRSIAKLVTPVNRTQLKTAACVLGSVALATMPLFGPGCADAYRQSADRDVYRLLEDRKKNALGYNPQAIAAPIVGNSLTATSSERSQLPGESPSNAATESAPATPVPGRAYSRLPLTPIPPTEPAALELPPTVAPWVPLGPFKDEIAEATFAPIDPFAAESATRSIAQRLVAGPVAPRRKPLELDLFGSVRYAVQHGRRYRDQMDEMYLAALDVTLERHLFSPRPFARTGLNYVGGQLDSSYNSALTATMDAGVRQKLPYGGEIVAETLVSFVRALDGNASNGESASLVLSGSIPLLRGAGLINLEALISSERELIYRIRAFEEFRRQYSIDVASAYFRLLASAQAVSNRRQNLRNSVSLLQRTQAIYSANLGAGAGNRSLRLTFLDVQRAEQQVLDGQSSLISSQQSYLNQIDDFKILIGMQSEADLEISPVSLALTIPDLVNRDLVAVALNYRLDLQTARDRIDDARRLVANAENGLLPDLLLTGRGEMGNRDHTAAKSLDSRNLTYSAGLQLDLPIDRVAERNVFRRSLVTFHRSQRQYDELRDQVASDVRTAVRAIQASDVSIQIQRRGIELNEKRLIYANLLLKRGDANARDVTDVQDVLLRTQDTYERARADLQVQVLQFLQQTGTLRVDPDSGTLGRALDRASARPPAERERAAGNAGAGPG